MPQKPAALPVLDANIPAWLKSLRIWVVWRYIPSTNAQTGEIEWDKPPVNAVTNGFASSTNPDTWCDYATAYAACRDPARNLDGLGIVLHRNPDADDDPNGLVGADLDKCVDPETGQAEEWARQVVVDLHTYTEVSPSGRGLRLLCLGLLPRQGRKKGKFEIYETGRYVTITGQVPQFQLAPLPIANRQAEITAVHARVFTPAVTTPDAEETRRQANPVPPPADDLQLIEKGSKGQKMGVRFSALMGGDYSAYASQSEADMAFCNDLAFLTGSDPDRMDRIFRISGMMRPKWDESHYSGGETYGHHTCAKAASECKTTYNPQHGRQPRAAGEPAPHGANGTNGTTTEVVVAAVVVVADEWEPIIPIGTVPDPPPFPLEVLPRGLADYVGQCAWATNSPEDFVAVPLLGMAAGCIGGSRALAITRDHIQAATLFAAVVGLPGSGKSPALERVLEPLEAAEMRWKDDWSPRYKLWKAAPKKTRGDKPNLRRLLIDDTTTEALMQTLGANPRGLCMVCDELAALVSGMNQYKGGAGHDRQVYLKIWAAAAIRVDRKSNPDGFPLTIRRPSLSIVGGIQPDVVEGLLIGKRGARINDGFLERYLFSYPLDLPAVAEGFREIEEPVARCWRDVVEYLLALNPQGDFESEEETRPRLVHLDAAGREAWVEFTRQHAAQLNSEDFPAYLRGVWSKMRGYGARLSLVLHFLRVACGEVQTEDIDGDSVRAAAILIGYFKAHYQRVAARMGADPQIDAANCVLSWLKRNEKSDFSHRDAWRNLCQNFANSDEMGTTLRLLEQHGYIRNKKVERASTGRQPSPMYDVCPTWLS